MNRRDMLRAGAAVAGLSVLGVSDRPIAAAQAPPREGSAAVPSPFRINFGRSDIRDLHRRLDAAKLPELPFDTGWAAGTNDGILRDLVRYWRHSYDWFAVQDSLSDVSHFRIPIAGEHIHFVRYTARRARHPVPLLLLHGWPGSYLEFGQAAPLLAGGLDGQPGFHVIVPSLPGYVFSDAPRAPGMDVRRIAERIHALMGALGYSRYGVQVETSARSSEPRWP